MQEYNVVFSETADKDLCEIVVYLSNFTPNIARRYYDEIMVKSLSLAFMPHRCSLSKIRLCVKKDTAGYQCETIRYFS